ncbi:MAG: adenylate/guanylate cyclase domain-containing protein, partial [Gallionella sp.]
MDSKTIFARTSKGEDEIRSKTAHLSGDIKRSLLMVDGTATYGEISKRAAPSLRSSLEEMFKELLRDGFIQDRNNTGKISKRAAPSGMVSKMVVPSRKAAAQEMPEEDGDIDLDFASEFRDHPEGTQPHDLGKDEAEVEAEAEARDHALAQAKEKQAANARAESEAQARAKAQARARREAEARARQDTEGESTDSIEDQARALQEARERAEAKARQGSGANDQIIAETKARQETDEIARLEAEAKAKRVAEAKARAGLIAQERALEEARARVEAEAKARREAEEKARAEAEAKARRETEAKAKARAEAEEKARQEAETEASLKHELEAAGQISTNLETRTTSATVLFFDVIGYTKQPVNKQIEIKKQFNRLVSYSLKKLGASERIILDTGDGAAIGFLQHPEEALKVAMQFRNTVTANQHNDYPELKVRMGIHLGPISIFNDINGLSNMVGDGINDAQRVMSFAGADQIYISRPYYDFISRLSSEYTSLFHYQGALPDKHGREHPVYKMVDAAQPFAEGDSLPVDMGALEVGLEPFNLTLPEASVSPVSPTNHSGLLPKEDVALLSDVGKFMQPEKVKKSPVDKATVQEHEQAVAPASEHMQHKAPPRETVKSDEEKHKPSVYEVKKLEEAQAKVWAEAEQRAKEKNKAKFVWDEDLPPEPQSAVKKAAPVARVKRKPLPWFKLVAGIIALALIILFVAPFLIPTKEYIPGIEKLLRGKFNQPVYIEHLKGRLLPTPRLDFIDMAIGNNKQFKAKLVRLDFAIPALFTAVKSIDSLELDDVEVDAASLEQTSELMQQAAADLD